MLSTTDTRFSVPRLELKAKNITHSFRRRDDLLVTVMLIKNFCYLCIYFLFFNFSLHRLSQCQGWRNFYELHMWTPTQLEELPWHVVGRVQMLPPKTKQDRIWTVKLTNGKSIHTNSMPHLQGLSNNPYSESNQLNASYYTYLFNIYSNIFFPSTPRPS